MKLLVATDAHIFVTPDGKHWVTSIYGYAFWTRYLSVFENVKIVARCKTIKRAEERYLLVDGPGVEVFGIPFFQGIKQFIAKYLAIRKRLKHVDFDCDAALLRMPSQTSVMVWSRLKKKIPLAGEIVFDPFPDVVNAKGFVDKFVSKTISRQLKKFCLQANGVAYVTEKTIQEHYPCRSILNGEGKGYFHSTFSSITLNERSFAKAKRNYAGKNRIVLSLSSVSMNSDRKGEKTLIKIVKYLRERKYDVGAIIIGDGNKKEEFIEFAQYLGVYDNIVFTGLLPTPEDVRRHLLDSDIYVFPTQGEGLPRGVIEAMASGLPVLSTPVGGIPEIIDAKYLFDPMDYISFAKCIERLIANPSELEEMSAANLAKSYDFKNDTLQEKRNVFYRKLKELVLR